MLRTALAATAALCLIAGGVEAGRRHHHPDVRLHPLFVPTCTDGRFCSIQPARLGIAMPRRPHRARHHHKPRKIVVAPKLLPKPASKAVIGPPPAVGERTAVYSITGHTVTLPNGRKLEAHSGLGRSRDNPDHVRWRARGPTPPGSYTLTLRVPTFHGVRAIRLNPTNQAQMHGRSGMLAHSYMLGPRGDSNGCISIRDYGAFLKAFLRGEINRIVVVGRL